MRHQTEINRLIDEYRTQCLWYMRPDFYPSNEEEALVVLRAIENHADLSGFRRATELRQWLSPKANERSVAS